MTELPDILRDIKDLDRRVRSLETTPQPPNIKLAPTAWGVFDLAAAGTAGDIVVVTATLSDDQDGRLLAVPQFSLYKSGGIPSDDRFPLGANWTFAEVRKIRLTSWFDWATTDQKNSVYKVMIINENAFGYTDLEIALDWRFMSREVSNG